MKGYPSWFERVLLACCAVLYVSGVLLIPTSFEMRSSIEFFWRLGGDERIWTGALHAAAAFLLMLQTGALWSVHMRSGWRRKQHWKTGILLASAFVYLAVTAVGVYYLANEAWANFSGLSHAILGLLLVLPFVIHYLAGHRSGKLRKKAKDLHPV